MDEDDKKKKVIPGLLIFIGVLILAAVGVLVWQLNKNNRSIDPINPISPPNTIDNSLMVDRSYKDYNVYLL